MTKLQNTALKNPVFAIIALFALFCIGFFVYSLYHRIITIDDAYFAEQAYWFAHDGYVHSELFEGFPLFSGRILVYHKLHVWQGALVYKLFGWNAYYFKAIALPYLIVFLGLIFYFLKFLTPAESRIKIFIIFLFLFFANHLVFQLGFEYRPEIPMMCIGFLSYIFLTHARAEKKPIYAMTAGILASLCALFHLDGLIFISAGGILLLINRQYKLAIWFGLGSLIGFLPYFYHLDNLELLRQYLFDLRHDPAVSEEDRTVLGMLKKVLFEYRRFTHHIYEFTYLLIFIITVATSWKRIISNDKYKSLFLYTLLLTFFMALITTGSKTMYLLYSMPYVLLLAATQFSGVMQNKKIAPVFASALLIFFLVNLDRNHGVNADEVYHSSALYARIAQKYNIQPGESIFAPATSIFNQIGRVHIQCYLAYLAKYHNNMSLITPKNILGDIYQRKKSFAILTSKMLDELGLKPRVGNVYNGYRCQGNESDLYIFKRVPDAHRTR